MNTPWTDRLNELRKFKNAKGHCRVPAGWKPNVQLARWVDQQRRLKIGGKIRGEREAQLDEIGLDWTPQATIWEVRFEQLRQFRKRFRSCNVPQTWLPNVQLGRWVAAQRRAKRDGKLGWDRFARLNRLDFEWNLDSKSTPDSNDYQDRSAVESGIIKKA